jgi:hypothetical protein
MTPRRRAARKLASAAAASAELASLEERKGAARLLEGSCGGGVGGEAAADACGRWGARREGRLLAEGAVGGTGSSGRAAWMVCRAKKGRPPRVHPVGGGPAGGEEGLTARWAGELGVWRRSVYLYI